VLDGMATFAVAMLAGGDPGTAIRLAGSMVALQASIGTLNDLIDAPADAGRKPGKPIPRGLVTPTQARLILGTAAVLGLVLAAMSGPGLALLALVILVVGYGYDLLAKGTPWSWLPFAVGIPLLPVFGWYGVDGVLPRAFAVLVPVAVAAGAGLAIANARADVERDLEAGGDSVAVRLGLGRAWRIEAALLGVVTAVALGTTWVWRGPSIELAASIGAGTIVLTGLRIGRPGASPVRRERAWEVEAIGVALLAAAWLAGSGGFAWRPPGQ
jgi:geranylgeranylglycerol-phosphate geranylgeranyltransferase